MNLIYKCPVCGSQLKKTDQVFKCGQNHNYDISKDGYVNLLLANQKNSKNPGDGKAMVENRKYFLEQGYYDRLSDKLNELMAQGIDENHPPQDIINILDLGCNEGFYAARLQSFLKKTKPSSKIQLWGIDISKPAIQKAAKRNADIKFCIGSNFQLPYLNESFDFLFSIFSPFDSKELQRVSKPGGKLVVVRPGKNHLKELASLVYEKFELQGNPLDLTANLDLRPVQTFELSYKIHLKDHKDIESLIGMTPYYWTLSEEKKQNLSQQQELTTTADFNLSLFQK